MVFRQIYKHFFGHFHICVPHRTNETNTTSHYIPHVYYRKRSKKTKSLFTTLNWKKTRNLKPNHTPLAIKTIKMYQTTYQEQWNHRNIQKIKIFENILRQRHLFRTTTVEIDVVPPTQEPPPLRSTLNT